MTGPVRDPLAFRLMIGFLFAAVAAVAIACLIAEIVPDVAVILGGVSGTCLGLSIICCWYVLRRR